MMDCRHKRGDWIQEMGFWLCPDCFARLDARPVRYGMVPTIPPTGDGGSSPRYRQEIVWQAAIATYEGVTLNAFLRAMAKRFIRRTRPQMDTPDAYDAAISCIKDLGDKCGDNAYDWSLGGARDLADEEMAYWEPAEGGNA